MLFLQALAPAQMFLRQFPYLHCAQLSSGVRSQTARVCRACCVAKARAASRKQAKPWTQGLIVKSVLRRHRGCFCAGFTGNKPDPKGHKTCLEALQHHHSNSFDQLTPYTSAAQTPKPEELQPLSPKANDNDP